MTQAGPRLSHARRAQIMRTAAELGLTYVDVLERELALHESVGDERLPCRLIIGSAVFAAGARMSLVQAFLDGRGDRAGCA